MQSTDNTLGKDLKRMRESNGVSREEMAEHFDISPRHLYNIEEGITKIKSETYAKYIKIARDRLATKTGFFLSEEYSDEAIAERVKQFFLRLLS